MAKALSQSDSYDPDYISTLMQVSLDKKNKNKTAPLKEIKEEQA